MSSKSEMTAVYTELAPQFLFYLGLEFDKIQKQIDRLKKADAEPVLDERDSSGDEEVSPVLLEEEAADADVDLDIETDEIATSDMEVN